jgi:integrase/recombinase XerD
MSAPVIQVHPVPSIAIFVRHSTDCPHKGDELYKRCRCPKHLRWSYGGHQYRKSAKTRSWQIAEERRREVEAQFEAADPSKSNGAVVLESVAHPTIKRAIELYISDKRSQGLDADILKKYERELGRFEDFMAKRSLLFPHEIQLEPLTEFRAGWDALYPSSTTRSKVQERLRGFLRYLYNAQMIDRIPQLSPIRIDEPPTMPLSEKEYKRLLKEVPKEFSGNKAKRVHALIQLMRYSGLAIQDAVTLEQSELKRDGTNGLYRIETSRQKTGTHVSVVIQPKVAEELKAVMELNSNPKYVFWSGNGKVKTVLSNWGNELRRLFRAAGFPEGHPHQLRDTFAVDLLGKGVPLEEVSKLLGHDSIKTTERHYAKWVKARQDRLDALVVGTWAAE